MAFISSFTKGKSIGFFSVILYSSILTLITLLNGNNKKKVQTKL